MRLPSDPPAGPDAETRAKLRTLIASAGEQLTPASFTFRAVRRPPASAPVELPRAVLTAQDLPDDRGALDPRLMAATLAVTPTVAEPRHAEALAQAADREALQPPPSVTVTMPDRSTLEQFELLECIGEGGMGVVYRARQRSLGRQVALKRARDGDPDALDRFVVEGRVTAWLEHPGIVPVHMMCRDDALLPHLAMKLVRGRDWLSMLNDPTVPMQRHVEVLIAVCNAVAFAHDAGVVHRDLKPANVMVGTYGEVYVLDWGIAFATDERAAAATGLAGVAPTDSPVGTPNFMAPEQIISHLVPQGPHTDVFQLGCCLHAVLTGLPRYLGADLEEVLRAAVAPRPYAYPKRLPTELVAIAIRATDPDPQLRPPSALALRDELRDWLTHSQADVFVTDGEASLQRIRVQPAQSTADRTALRQLFREGRAAFDAALRIWPHHPAAIAGRRALLAEQVRAALAAGDLSQARTTADELADPELLAEVAKVEAAAAERERELVAYREQQSRQSWREIAVPQSEICLFAAVLALATGTAVTMLTDDWTDVRQQKPVLLWLLAAFLMPLFAEWRMRRVPAVVRVQVNAMHLIGGPATLVCGLLVVLHWLRGESLWLAVGLTPFVASVAICGLAVLWKRWLLVPAAICALAGLVGSLAGQWLMLVQSAGMALAMVYIAIALRTGARLLPQEPDAPPVAPPQG